MKSSTAVTALFALAVATVTERAAFGQEQEPAPAPAPEPEPVPAPAPEPAPEPAAAPTAAPTDQFTLRFSGYAQIDWVIHNQASQDEVDHSTGLPLNQDRFLLRRGHVRLDAEQGLLAAALEIDLNTVIAPQVRPVDAEISFHWPQASGPDSRAPQASGPNDFSLAVALGLMKIPFGFEVPERDSARPFLERSTAMRALFPGEYDLGARLSVRYGPFEGAVAVMNGNPSASRIFPALAPTADKDFIGRLGARAEIGPVVTLEAGVSAETGTGFHPGTPTTKDQLVWRDENGDGVVQATEVEVIAGSSATPSQTFHRFALGADARLTVSIEPLGDLALRAEIVRSENLDRGVELADPVSAGHDLRELGWYLGATQEITSWAMVGARYDRYDPDQDASQQEALNLVPVNRSYSTLALMAMLRYGKGRLVLEYDRNDNALGRDPSGAPTTLKADALTLRGQVVF